MNTKENGVVEEVEVILIVEIVDVEEYAIRGEPKPRAKRYRIRVDKQYFEVECHTITGRQILALVCLPAPQYCVYQHIRGQQPRKIGLDEAVDLTAPGVERFTTMKCNLTDGRGEPNGSREFRLPDTDERYLASFNRPFDTIIDGGTRWLIIRGVEIPPGFNHALADVALVIPATYPDTQIDMAYFSPALARTDGKPIPTLCVQAIRGESWQRWSRHRSPDNPWRPSIDDVSTHLIFVNEWFLRELGRK